MYANRLALMDRFTSTMDTLRALSEKELSKTPFSAADNLFFQHLVEFDYTGERTYSGWYPNCSINQEANMSRLPARLQSGHRRRKGSDYWDALVTTVHTDPPDVIVGDPGSILHEAVGNVQFMLIAVDCGPGDLAVYGAPVLSHYEFQSAPPPASPMHNGKAGSQTTSSPLHRIGPKAIWFPSKPGFGTDSAAVASSGSSLGKLSKQEFLH